MEMENTKNCDYSNENNDDSFFLFTLIHLIEKKQVDYLILDLLDDKENDHSIKIMNNLPLIAEHTKFLREIIEYLIFHNQEFSKILRNINIKNLNEQSFTEILTFLNTQEHDFNNYYNNNSHYLYELLEQIKEKEGHNVCIQFQEEILLPLLEQGADEYLNFALNKLHLEKIKPIYLNSGLTSYAFRLEDFVLKLTIPKVTWNIPFHYRMNEFIIRKKFKYTTIDITPFGDVNKVTCKDINDAIYDLKKDNIIIKDCNFKNNFALVDFTIPKKMFRDVEGINEYIINSPSKTYIKRPIKLIDQDAIQKK